MWEVTREISSRSCLCSLLFLVIKRDEVWKSDSTRSPSKRACVPYLPIWYEGMCTRDPRLRERSVLLITSEWSPCWNPVLRWGGYVYRGPQCTCGGISDSWASSLSPMGFSYVGYLEQLYLVLERHGQRFWSINPKRYILRCRSLVAALQVDCRRCRLQWVFEGAENSCSGCGWDSSSASTGWYPEFKEDMKVRLNDNLGESWSNINTSLHKKRRLMWYNPNGGILILPRGNFFAKVFPLCRQCFAISFPLCTQNPSEVVKSTRKFSKGVGFSVHCQTALVSVVEKCRKNYWQSCELEVFGDS